MSRPSRPSDPAHLVLGATLLGVAAWAVPTVPGPVVALGVALGMLRLLWLEENIHDALVAASARRAGPDPRRRATEMRAAAQAWSVALAGTMAAVAGLALHGGMGLLGFAAAFGIGLWRVDRLAATLDVLARGGALDVDRLGRAPAAALSSRVRGRR